MQKRSMSLCFTVVWDAIWHGLDRSYDLSVSRADTYRIPMRSYYTSVLMQEASSLTGLSCYCGLSTVPVVTKYEGRAGFRRIS